MANKSKTFLRESLIEVIITLFVAVLVVSYASYAWFTMSSTDLANGISLNISVPDNLLISLTGQNGSWTEDLNITQDDIKKLNTNQTIKPFCLLPSSSLTGFNNSFYVTSSAKITGEAIPGTYFKNATPNILNDGIYQGYYVDIPIYFKTEDNIDFDLYLEKTVSGISTSISPSTNVSEDIYKSARVAFLSTSKDKNSMNTFIPLILASDESHNLTAITSSSIVDGDPKPISYIPFTGGFSDVPIVNIKGMDYSGTEFESITKIVLRIWIEGQDPSCTVGHGGQNFSVSLKFTRK